jgi:5-methyltetrahydrofolate--homocysteine methyltransferase
MHSILHRLNDGEILVSDGAVGTFLQEQGLEPGACPEMFNIDRPELIQEFAKRYINTGADIVQTNTFGGSPLKLADYGLEGRTEELNRRGVELARSAAGTRIYVAGSVGPSGKLLKPFGEIDPEIMRDSYQQQIRVLIDSGVNLILIETMTDLQEALLALAAVRNVSSSIPAAVTLTFDVTPQGSFTIMGDNVKTACEKLIYSGADIIGSNCGNGIENMLVLAREFADHSSVPTLIQANAGKPFVKNGTIVYPESPEYFSKFIPELMKLGVSVIGGCCGTTPEHIRLIRSTIVN